MAKKIVVSVLLVTWMWVLGGLFAAPASSVNLSNHSVKQQQVVAGDPDPRWIEGVQRQVVAGNPDPRWIEGVQRQVVAGDPDPRWIEGVQQQVVAGDPDPRWIEGVVHAVA